MYFQNEEVHVYDLRVWKIIEVLGDSINQKKRGNPESKTMLNDASR